MQIKSLNAKNYRSLKEITVPDFQDTTIFFGDNNAGKSNILNLLYLIFKVKPKQGDNGDLTAAENFYSGIISNSENNFFNNEIKAPITFVVDVECLKDELSVNEIISSLFTQPKNIFTFKGSITAHSPFDNNLSDFAIEEVLVDQTSIYTIANGFAYFKSIDKEGKKASDFSRAFTVLMNAFNDCVDIIGSHRDMIEAKIESKSSNILSPNTFKKFLYSLYVSKKNHKVFEQIDKVFSESPFSYGHISFSEVADHLEIEIKEKDFRLPIKHLGSGVLQVLYIITSVIWSKSKIICIEELEQNLSPKNQREIIAKIQALISNNDVVLNQIIISSHSEQYSDSKLGSIYLIEKNNGETFINEKEKESVSEKLQKHLRPTASRNVFTGSQPV